MKPSQLPAERVPATLPALADVDAAARQLGLAVDASELHGSLCGWLAGGGTESPGWLAGVFSDEALPTIARDSTLEQLGQASAGQLRDRSFSFQLLLPAADAALAVRSGALFDWCRGFLGGFGLAAGAAPGLSEESREALADIAKLAAAVPQDDGDEDDEAALAEIEEFVRVAVLLIHGDCVLALQHRQQFN